MNKSPLSAKLLKLLFMPHSGYTEGMEARYIIQYDLFTELYVCRWESLVEIDGEKHILHANAYIPMGESHNLWLEANNPLAIEKLKEAYHDYMANHKRVYPINDKELPIGHPARGSVA